MSESREEIINNLFENMDNMKRVMHSHIDVVNKDCPISRTQIELLITIKHLQPINFTHLAQKLRLTPGAVSQLAEALEKHALILRETDADDRRIQYLRLSKRGEKQLQDIEKRRHGIIKQVMQDLSTDELATWVRIQQKMTAQFQNELEKQTF